MSIQTHEHVETELIEEDLAQISEFVAEQIKRFTCDFNYPDLEDASTEIVIQPVYRYDVHSSSLGEWPSRLCSQNHS